MVVSLNYDVNLGLLRGVRGGGGEFIEKEDTKFRTIEWGGFQ